MNRQDQTISRFRKLYPHLSLRQTSELTGINISRIHRILKGASMKLNEWECFSRAINQKTAVDGKLKNVFDECLITLSPQGKNQLLSKLESLQKLSQIAGAPKQKGAQS
ncbi:MAG: hypothetical protein OXB88_01955 [Bacteriovoracales bacterium]|nr:hypothetical protein [Bacteriovoracales bacterium]